MKAKIAVVTVSGKAYYKLVNELKARDLPFLSLTPRDTIPLDIVVAITTATEHSLVTHPNVLIFNDDADPAAIINEAIRIAEGKREYDTIIVGVDPGKTFGLAVLSDGKVLETVICSSMEETVKTILRILERLPATVRTVKIGNGAPSYTQELLPELDKALPRDVAIEIVSEAGTSHFIGENVHRRGLRDVTSAIKIAERRGQTFQRKETQ